MEEADMQATSEHPAEIRESDYQPIGHFFILCFFSFGIYLFFWFYKHWRYLKEEKNMELSPGFKTLLIAFTGYSLFSKFRVLAREKGYAGKTPNGLLFFLYTLIILLARLPGTPLIIILFAFFAFALLIPALSMMNFYYLKEQAGCTIRTTMRKDEVIFLVLLWVVLIFLVVNGLN